ncbi:MAG TPA: S41 family peptidase [Candidatus Paceibacterota bacterium]
MQSTSHTSKTTLRAFGAFLFTIIVFLSGLYIGVHQTSTYAQSGTQTITASSTQGTPSITLDLSGNSEPSNVDLTPLWHTWNLLQGNFVETHASSSIPTDQQKVYGMIQGLVDSYGDPYTTFFPPQEAQMFDENVSGSFSGVGMEVGSQNGALTVIAPLKGSPAEAAGIKSGDKILMIDSKDTTHLSVDEAVKLIRGPKGTTVKITISRAGESEPRVIAIMRDTINIPSINYTDHADSKVFEIDLYNFSAVSSDDFRKALRAFFQSGDTRLLLDLRGNPGGYLDAAVDMASYFLPAGDVVVTEDFRGSQDNIVHRSFGYNVFANKKLSMAILMDQGTASAAEILSGALQQHGVATLVGTRSFGKGSVQELFDLGGGAQVKITIARWLTPNGTSISDGGLTPDINATTTPDDLAAGRDPQKDAAIQYLVNH